MLFHVYMDFSGHETLKALLKDRPNVNGQATKLSVYHEGTFIESLLDFMAALLFILFHTRIEVKNKRKMQNQSEMVFKV